VKKNLKATLGVALAIVAVVTANWLQSVNLLRTAVWIDAFS